MSEAADYWRRTATDAEASLRSARSALRDARRQLADLRAERKMAERRRKDAKAWRTRIRELEGIVDEWRATYDYDTDTLRAELADVRADRDDAHRRADAAEEALRGSPPVLQWSGDGASVERAQLGPLTLTVVVVWGDPRSMRSIDPAGWVWHVTVCDCVIAHIGPGLLRPTADTAKADAIVAALDWRESIRP